MSHVMQYYNEYNTSYFLSFPPINTGDDFSAFSAETSNYSVVQALVSSHYGELTLRVECIRMRQ